MKGGYHSGNLGVDGRIILKLILWNTFGRCGLDSPVSGYGSVAGCCEHGDEPTGYMKWGEWFDWLSLLLTSPNRIYFIQLACLVLVS
jgi:hypothetical protein